MAHEEDEVYVYLHQAKDNLIDYFLLRFTTNQFIVYWYLAFHFVFNKDTNIYFIRTVFTLPD